MPVDEAMTPLPYVVRPDAPLEEVVRQLLKKRIGSALVVEKEKVVGVFTTTDALQVLLELLEKAPKARSPKQSAKGS